MYYEYWNLTKAPFDNVPDPSMYADCHSSMENALAETLFAIEEGEDCFAVIVGDIGLGKTLSIRMVLDSINQENYKIALVTNPSLTFVQLMREIIGQLIGNQCEEKKKVDLLEIFNNILFETYDEGKKVLIFIDEANVITRKNLENLRLLTNMQDDDKNLFTMVLAGQIELARRLEHPSLANLFQRIGTYCKIEKIESEDLVKSYVETRLTLAGSDKPIFTTDAFKSIWDNSENGVPRLINKICKLSLKAGETNELTEINSDIVENVGSRFKKRGNGDAIKPIKRNPKPLTEHVTVNKKVPDCENTIETDSEVGHNGYFSKLTDSINNINNVNTIDNARKENFIEDLNPSNPKMLFDSNMEIMDENSAKIQIGQLKVKVNFPNNFILQARSASREDRMKIAGAMAAKIIKGNPKLTSSGADDPVSIWGDLRDMIINKIEHENVAV